MCPSYVRGMATGVQDHRFTVFYSVHSLVCMFVSQGYAPAVLYPDFVL